MSKKEMELDLIKIEQLREEMFLTYSKNGIKSNQLLEISQELDQLIYRYQVAICKKNKKIK